MMDDKQIKDKNPLEEARHKTELRMEQWKNYEQEKKTKTYSRAGLSKNFDDEKDEDTRQAEE